MALLIVFTADRAKGLQREKEITQWPKNNLELSHLCVDISVLKSPLKHLSRCQMCSTHCSPLSSSSLLVHFSSSFSPSQIALRSVNGFHSTSWGATPNSPLNLVSPKKSTCWAVGPAPVLKMSHREALRPPLTYSTFLKRYFGIISQFWLFF